MLFRHIAKPDMLWDFGHIIYHLGYKTTDVIRSYFNIDLSNRK